MLKNIYFQQNCKNTLQWIRKTHREAFNIKLGDNGIVKGYFYNLPDRKIKVFTPLLDTIKV